jgi:hypothetical protein
LAKTAPAPWRGLRHIAAPLDHQHPDYGTLREIADALSRGRAPQLGTLIGEVVRDSDRCRRQTARLFPTGWNQKAYIKNASNRSAQIISERQGPDMDTTPR